MMQLPLPGRVTEAPDGYQEGNGCEARMVKKKGWGRSFVLPLEVSY